MSVAMPSISTSAQTLIDARLDVIERILMERMNRQDRLTIVREVESQIHELLAERGVDEASREDVLAVLASLDPPEAYMTDEETGRAQGVGPRLAPAAAPSPTAAVKTPSWMDYLALSSGILGLTGLAAALIMTLSLWVLYMGVSVGNAVGQILYLGFYGGISVAAIAGMSATALALYSRFHTRWALTGTVCGVLSLLAVAAGFWFVILEK